jgi:hypothetical protein
MAVRPAAWDHLLSFEASQRLVAIYESGHAVAAAGAPTKVPVRAIDITLRHGGSTALGRAFEDTSLPWDTTARMLDNMMVAMAGAAAERQVLGEHTNDSESDYDLAVTIALRFIKAGFGGPGMFVGEDGLPLMYLTNEYKSRTLARIQELVAEAQARADALIAEHQDALILAATAVYEQRRLADERPNAVLESAGFTLPRPTAWAYRPLNRRGASRAHRDLLRSDPGPARGSLRLRCRRREQPFLARARPRDPLDRRWTHASRAARPPVRAPVGTRLGVRGRGRRVGPSQPGRVPGYRGRTRPHVD